MMFLTWEYLGEHYANNNKVVIAELDCTPKKNLKVCRAMDVGHYPTYILFKNGQREKKMSGRQQRFDLIEHVEDLLDGSAILRDET